MRTRYLLVVAASSLLVVAMSACQITRDGNTLIVEPATGVPRDIPPERISRTTINGDCYIVIEHGGENYCVPCEDVDEDGEHGHPEPCDDIVGQSATAPYTIESFFADVADAVGIDATNDAMIKEFGFDNWQSGNDFDVPIAINDFDTDDSTIDVLVLARDDWGMPLASTGVDLDWLYLGDPTDSNVDVVAMRLTGTLKQVADGLASMFVDGYTLQGDVQGGGQTATVVIEGEPDGSNDYETTLTVDGIVEWQE